MEFGRAFSSGRSAAVGHSGAVCASTPAASLAGYRMLQEGGNAADAIIAMAAALVVTEPTSNGLGSDLFAIICKDGKLHGINASGRAPAAITAEAMRQKGNQTMPLLGWDPVTVPGMVRGWADISGRFGRLGLKKALEPAILLAQDGYAVPPIVAYFWGFAASRLGGYEGFRRAFMPHGRAPRAGELFRHPGMAEALREIGISGGESFYSGRLADAMADASQKEGGYLTKNDLSSHVSEWVDPIGVNYRGYDVFEIPPNGQGIVALMALNLLESCDLSGLSYDDPVRVNLIAEALRLSFADAHERLCDPRFREVPVQRMLDKGYAAERASLITRGKAMQEAPTGLPWRGGTVYLCAADADGMMVSLIQSNYMGFGSGIVIPEHGISLQNRGAGFSLVHGHPNELEPGKRPFHTIIPGFLMKDGAPLGPFGVMGGDMQPQGHVQLISSIVDMGLGPQSGIDMPRFRVSEGRKLHLEKGLGHIEGQMAEMGYEVSVEKTDAMFGGGQMIIRDAESGAYTAGTESRKDGIAIAF